LSIVKPNLRRRIYLYSGESLCSSTPRKGVDKIKFTAKRRSRALH
jgi:hypothetical protein